MSDEIDDQDDDGEEPVQGLPPRNDPFWAKYGAIVVEALASPQTGRHLHSWSAQHLPTLPGASRPTILSELLSKLELDGKVERFKNWQGVVSYRRAGYVDPATPTMTAAAPKTIAAPPKEAASPPPARETKDMAKEEWLKAIEAAALAGCTPNNLGGYAVRRGITRRKGEDGRWEYSRKSLENAPPKSAAHAEAGARRKVLVPPPNRTELIKQAAAPKVVRAPKPVAPKSDQEPAPVGDVLSHIKWAVEGARIGAMTDGQALVRIAEIVG